jgi:chromatin remodeling complex protein RSC6
MKKTSKTAKSAEPVAVAVAVVPVVEKKAKAPKAKAEKVEEKKAVETVEVATPEVAVEEDVGASLQKSIADLQEQLASLKTATASAATALKTIEKQATRLAKKADRRRKRKAEAVEGAEPKPCIFTKPVKITAELCSFLGKPKDTEVSRSSVTKGVMEYARNHNLMDKQTIKADAALRKLLTLAEGDVLTILNLQKYLRRHYVKPATA